jgi:hypothetical protein
MAVRRVFEVPRAAAFRAPSLLSFGIAIDRTIAWSFADHIYGAPYLIFSISRQKLLRIAVTETPNTRAISFHS